MDSKSVWLLAVGVAAAGAVAVAQTPAPQGYLTAETAPDTIAVLPPAPVAGTTRYEADRTTFLATRSLEGTPRWAMAQGDVPIPAIYKGMACSLGVELTAQNAPRTLGVIRRLGPDVGRAYDRPKNLYKRPRPYRTDAGAICTPRSAALDDSFDYPSGHVVYGWTLGLILAELAPDRATPILARARAFGESRLVCGVHTLAAVQAGRDTGSVLVAALHGNPEFRKDMDAARKEIAALRRAGPAPDAAACKAEAEVVAKSPY